METLAYELTTIGMLVSYMHISIIHPPASISSIIHESIVLSRPSMDLSWIGMSVSTCFQTLLPPLLWIPSIPSLSQTLSKSWLAPPLCRTKGTRLPKRLVTFNIWTSSDWADGVGPSMTFNYSLPLCSLNLNQSASSGFIRGMTLFHIPDSPSQKLTPAISISVVYWWDETPPMLTTDLTTADPILDHMWLSHRERMWIKPGMVESRVHIGLVFTLIFISHFPMSTCLLSISSADGLFYLSCRLTESHCIVPGPHLLQDSNNPLQRRTQQLPSSWTRNWILLDHLALPSWHGMSQAPGKTIPGRYFHLQADMIK